VDGYYTRGRDFIASRLSVPPFTYVMENISRVRMAGLDLDVRSWVTEDAAVYAGYGYTRSTVVEDESKPANEGNDLAFQPRRKMRVGVSFDDHERYTIDLSANFIGDRYTDIENTYLLEDYLSLDLHASWRFGEHIRGFVNLENMLDERYELYSLPLDESYAPGFLGTVGVEISF